MTEPKRPTLIAQIQRAEMQRRLERLRGHLRTVQSMTPQTQAVYDALIRRLTHPTSN